MAEGVQLITDTMPKQGGHGGSQTREEVVDAICCDLVAKVRLGCGEIGWGAAVCGRYGDVDWLAYAYTGRW